MTTWIIVILSILCSILIIKLSILLERKRIKDLRDFDKNLIELGEIIKKYNKKNEVINESK